MEMTKELMEKAKAAKTAEELLDLAKAQGIAMEKEEAEAQCHYLNDIGGYPAPFLPTRLSAGRFAKLLRWGSFLAPAAVQANVCPADIHGTADEDPFPDTGETGVCQRRGIMHGLHHGITPVYWTDYAVKQSCTAGTVFRLFPDRIIRVLRFVFS